VAIAWKDPNNITEELAPEIANKGSSDAIKPPQTAQAM